MHYNFLNDAQLCELSGCHSIRVIKTTYINTLMPGGTLMHQTAL